MFSGNSCAPLPDKSDESMICTAFTYVRRPTRRCAHVRLCDHSYSFINHDLSEWIYTFCQRRKEKKCECSV